MRCLAFDLDGTLITCRQRQVSVARRALTDAGWLLELDGERFWANKREGATTREALVAIGIPSAVVDEAAARWRMMVEDEQWQNLDRPFPQAKAALQRARAGGAPGVIVTARRSPSTASRQVSVLGLESLVDGLVVVPPGREGVEKAEALRRLSAAGFVGDSELDHLSSTIAGVRFAAVSSGQRSAGFLQARGISPVYDDVEAATRALLDVAQHPKALT